MSNGSIILHSIKPPELSPQTGIHDRRHATSTDFCCIISLIPVVIGIFKRTGYLHVALMLYMVANYDLDN